jgi:hypothetical protein
MPYTIVLEPSKRAEPELARQAVVLVATVAMHMAAAAHPLWLKMFAWVRSPCSSIIGEPPLGHDVQLHIGPLGNGAVLR